MHLRKGFAAVLMGAGLIGAALVGPASADNGSVHYVSCPDTSFVSNVGGYTFEYCFSDVVTSSGNANAHFQGQLLDPAAAPAKATTIEGFGCTAGYNPPSFYGSTTDTRLVVTPSGKVNGSCKFHPSA
jgi:hypothetical protein